MNLQTTMWVYKVKGAQLAAIKVKEAFGTTKDKVSLHVKAILAPRASIAMLDATPIAPLVTPIALVPMLL